MHQARQLRMESEAISARIEALKGLEKAGEDPDKVVAASSALLVARAIYDVGAALSTELARIDQALRMP